MLDYENPKTRRPRPSIFESYRAGLVATQVPAIFVNAVFCTAVEPNRWPGPPLFIGAAVWCLAEGIALYLPIMLVRERKLVAYAKAVLWSHGVLTAMWIAALTVIRLRTGSA